MSSSNLASDHPDLPPAVARAVREKALVMASRAPGANRHVPQAELPGAVGEKGAQVDGGGRAHLLAGQLPVHVRAYLVAFAADRGAEVHPQLGHRKSSLRER